MLCPAESMELVSFQSEECHEGFGAVREGCCDILSILLDNARVTLEAQTKGQIFVLLGFWDFGCRQ